MKPRSYPNIEPLESRIAPAPIIAPVRPETFFVTNDHDSGTGSLRAALAASDAHTPLVGANWIVFRLPAPPAHGENIITLTTGALTTAGDVNIVGPGAEKLIINGDGEDRVFWITGTTGLTSISGLSIVNGKSTGYGGGIYSTGSLALKNVVISGNSAAGGSGGGIDVPATGGTLKISDSSIIDNTASVGGGGIAFAREQTVTISNTVITANRVTGTSATDEGGGILGLPDSTGAVVDISGCRISSNTAAVGGGLYLGSSGTPAITIKSTKITGNTALYAGLAGGGGLYLAAGKVVIAGSTIRANAARYTGGGIQAEGIKSLTVSGSTISSNQTTSSIGGLGAGGGLFVEGSGSPKIPVTILNSEFSGNQTFNSGGGLYAANDLALKISGSTFSGNQAEQVGGGGIAVYGATSKGVDVTVTGCTISNNFIPGIGKGGGFYAGGDVAVTITSTKVSDNFAFSGGGLGIFSSALVKIDKVAVTDNFSVTMGGGIRIGQTPNFKIEGSSITGNGANLAGGGVYSGSGSTGSIKDTTISGIRPRPKGAECTRWRPAS
jgi:predicted outer membrane repeat protein